MENTIRHTTDWTYSTIASWLGVTIASLYYANSQILLIAQIPVHLMILAVLWFVIKRPNDQVNIVALTYFLLIVSLMQLSTTSLVFIHLIMFTAIFSAHFSPIKMICSVIAILATYSITNFDRWQGDIPWVTLIVWAFFCLMNWFVSRKIIQSLNIHYQSRQNYKELKATQSIMNAMSAEQERLNLSRELHDTLGHKLTALSINLDFAKRKATAESEENLTLCHSLTQELLDEVRSIVSTQRAEISLLRTSLEQVFKVTPQLACTLNLDKKLSYLNQNDSLCVIRFCQEMISNTLKHTQATEITFNVELKFSDHTGELLDKDTLTATAVHNQSEYVLSKPGNGLMGLKERIMLMNGKFKQEIIENRLVNEISFPIQLITHGV
ncbi:histidine kinase [Pseudoalteromonas sp. NBT06-2]|uniref:sensor histidine kinase n=1 Tax=Pseudoalteromonas sp. NBT06-2 TaxID=2025950 RepID=UPI000BA5AB02|nr:histidine kinase [Pseudoalteromonas sp. NBT06-2]PAJ73116.1 histidine kinase [Pseudoalteromonas sp. NBT06-2]